MLGLGRRGLLPASARKTIRPGRPTGAQHIARGGSFRALVPVHGRWSFKPGEHLPDLGFRVACEVSNVPVSKPPSAPVASEAEPRKENFVSLFNGRDLTGWVPEAGHPRDWRIEQGDSRLSGGRAGQRLSLSRSETTTRIFICG